MKPSRLLFAIAALALTLLFTVWVPTASAASAPPSPPIDMRVLVKSVDVSACTGEIEHAQSHTTHAYTVDGITMITVNGQKGTIAQIKAGMKVVSSIERDSHSLDSISVAAAAPTPAPKK